MIRKKCGSWDSSSGEPMVWINWKIYSSFILLENDSWWWSIHPTDPMIIPPIHTASQTSTLLVAAEGEACSQDLLLPNSNACQGSCENPPGMRPVQLAFAPPVWMCLVHLRGGILVRYLNPLNWPYAAPLLLLSSFCTLCTLCQTWSFKM